MIMKKIIFTFLLLLTSACFLYAQTETQLDSAASIHPGNTQINVYGGVSMPLGTYKGNIGRVNLGPVIGLGIDHYFKGNHWGIGMDFRYFQHTMRKFNTDTFHFATGFRTMEMSDAKGFKNYALSIGPSYKFSRGKLDIEAFLRGGILWQSFPQYEQQLFVLDMVSNTYVEALKPMYTDNETNNPKSLMGLAGVKFTYNFTENIGLFLQTDYLRGLGEKLGEGKSGFYVSSNSVLKEIQEFDKIYIRNDETNVYDYYSKERTSQQTFVQAFNVSLGLKISFGGKNKTKEVSGGSSGKLDNKNGQTKEILVVVKDKRTGLALSGVKVNISSKENGDFVSITNSNGEADRIQNAKPGAYIISGDKNGLATSIATIEPSDFDKDNAVIYKEIFQDDSRFTLIGETMECETQKPISGISTILTNTSNNSVVNQISDNEGKFIYQLDQNRDYTVVANQSGKYSQTELISTKGLDRNKTLFVTLKLGVCPIEEGATFILKNIFYDFDKSNIRQDAARVLDNLVNIMKKNPSMKIELSAHTDSRGNDNYNLRLSQQRAQAAVNYLISKGIKQNRITAKGYGETRLVNGCGNGITCTEEQHEQNRRTEIKVLKY